MSPTDSYNFLVGIHFVRTCECCVVVKFGSGAHNIAFYFFEDGCLRQFELRSVPELASTFGRNVEANFSL